MGFYRGPNIVRDGLVFGYDADDRSSRFYKGEPTTNLISNPNGKNISSGYSIQGEYKPGWDNSLHTDAILVDYWSGGYNGGVGSPEVGYHARWVYGGVDGKNDPCMFFQDENSAFSQTHRWLGISATWINLPSFGITTGDSITISWMQKASIIGKGAQVGIYHKVISNSGYGFEDAIKFISVNNIGVWEKVSFTFTITSNWNLSNYVCLYVYGYNGVEGKLWVDNVQVEKKAHATQFTISSRSATNSLIDLTKTYTIDLSNTNFDSTAHPYFNGGVGEKIITNFTSQLNDFTACVWYKCMGKSGSGYDRLLDKQYNDGFTIMRDGITDSRWGGSILNAASPYGIYLTLPDGEWHYIVTVRSGSTHYLYGDGVDNKVSESCSTTPLSANSLAVGCWSALDSTQSFVGYAPVVQIYNRALSESEILQNYNALKSRFIN